MVWAHYSVLTSTESILKYWKVMLQNSIYFLQESNWKRIVGLSLTTFEIIANWTVLVLRNILDSWSKHNGRSKNDLMKVSHFTTFPEEKGVLYPVLWWWGGAIFSDVSGVIDHRYIIKKKMVSLYIYTILGAELL